MNPDVFIDTMIERLSARDLDGAMSLDFTDAGVLALMSPRGTVHVGESPHGEGGITWTLWRDGDEITAGGVPDLSDHSLGSACREVGRILGI